jgi:hypothetical protein
MYIYIYIYIYLFIYLFPAYGNGSWRIKTNKELDKIIKYKNIINFARAQRQWDGLAISKECQKQEWSRQYTPGNPFQRDQQEDQRHAGRMMLKKYTEVKISNRSRRLRVASGRQPQAPLSRGPRASGLRSSL